MCLSFLFNRILTIAAQKERNTNVIGEPRSLAERKRMRAQDIMSEKEPTVSVGSSALLGFFFFEPSTGNLFLHPLGNGET